MIQIIPPYTLRLILSLYLLGACFFLTSPTEKRTFQTSPLKTSPVTIPKKEMAPLAADGKLTAFLLHSVPMKMSLPDLRSQLLYYGALSRPDSDQPSPFLLLGLRGQTDIIHAHADTPLFLQYDNEKNQWKQTEKSPLKLTFSPQEKTLVITQEIALPNGQSIKEPQHLARFSIPLMPPPQTLQTEKVTIDDIVIDQHFWEIQHASWWGKDALYETLSEDSQKKQSQRLLLTSPNGTLYTLWAQEGDGFLYSNGRWMPVELGSESRNQALLYVRSLTEKTIDFEIWSPTGTYKISLPLTKKEESKVQSTPTINLIGARSRSTWIATINDERILLHTDDWFLLNEGVLEKLDSKQALDDYIQGKKEGTLLAFSGIERIGNEQKLIGISIDPTRTKTTPIAISLFHSWDSQKEPSKANKGNSSDHYKDLDDRDEMDDDDMNDILDEDFAYDEE
jgi:hypothetical protein